MRFRSSVVRCLVIVLALGAMLPGAAVARPSEEACAAYRAVPFSALVPATMRTAGTHRFEWRSTYTNVDGTTGEDLVQNQVTIVTGAALYPNTVLLRLFRNTTLLFNGEVVEVPEMNPAQAATFYIAAYSIKGDDVFLDSLRTWLRYETSRNDWTPWVELKRGPDTNFCTQVTTAVWKKSYGWD